VSTPEERIRPTGNGTDSENLSTHPSLPQPCPLTEELRRLKAGEITAADLSPTAWGFFSHGRAVGIDITRELVDTAQRIGTIIEGAAARAASAQDRAEAALARANAESDRLYQVAYGPPRKPATFSPSFAEREAARRIFYARGARNAD
jgi:hypothetical protein